MFGRKASLTVHSEATKDLRESLLENAYPVDYGLQAAEYKEHINVEEPASPATTKRCISKQTQSRLQKGTGYLSYATMAVGFFLTMMNLSALSYDENAPVVSGPVTLAAGFLVFFLSLCLDGCEDRKICRCDKKPTSALSRVGVFQPADTTVSTSLASIELDNTYQQYP